jgi:hypothetical protein
MSWPVEFDLEARLEFDQAADWYEQQKSGLGVQFVEELTASLTLIAQSPTMFAQVAPGIRQVCVRRFPFRSFIGRKLRGFWCWLFSIARAIQKLGSRENNPCLLPPLPAPSTMRS